MRHKSCIPDAAPSTMQVCHMRYAFVATPFRFDQTLRGCNNAACPFRHEERMPARASASPASSADATNILGKYSAVRIAESKGVEAEVRKK